MKRLSISLNPQSRGIDKQLLFVVLALVVFGVVMVANSSVVEAERNFGDKFFYARQQVLWALIGLTGLFFFAKFPHQKLERFAALIFWGTVGLLVLVLVPGMGVKVLGASRWLRLGPLVVQPAELAKFSLILCLAKILTGKNKASPLGSLFAFLFLTATVVGLLIAQPDLGTSIVIAATAAVVYFTSGAPISYFLMLVPLALVSFLALIFSSTYRRERLLTYLNPSIDPQGASYHIRQVLIALGSGGLFGVGLGQSRQKYLFLPEASTDSIFAVIGEELGFLGASVVLLAFVFIIYKGFTIAAKSSNDFSKLLAVGISSWIAIQAFVNLGAMVSLLPLTGIPLPFISYGGSSLVVTLSAIGVLLNISKSSLVKTRK